MNQKMIHCLLSTLAHANTNLLQYSLLLQVITSEYLPSSHHPNKKGNSLRDLHTPFTFPRESDRRRPPQRIIYYYYYYQYQYCRHHHHQGQKMYKNKRYPVENSLSFLATCSSTELFEWCQLKAHIIEKTLFLKCYQIPSKFSLSNFSLSNY